VAKRHRRHGTRLTVGSPDLPELRCEPGNRRPDPDREAALVDAISRRPIELIQAGELLDGSGARRTVLEVFERPQLRCPGVRRRGTGTRGGIGDLSAGRLPRPVGATAQHNHRSGEELQRQQRLGEQCSEWRKPRPAAFGDTRDGARTGALEDARVC
jgi:hypothetical protein